MKPISGDKIIMKQGQSVPMWLDGFAGYVINVYHKSVSVRVPVNDERITRVSFKDIKCIESSYLKINNI